MFYFLKNYKKQRQDILSEIKDLLVTVDTLKSNITELHQEFSLIQNANTEQRNLKLDWFEDEVYLKSLYEDRMDNGHGFDSYREIRDYAEYLKKQKKIKYIMENPSLKMQQVYHGGCLGCKTPIKDGIKSCLGCKYFNGVVSNYPDLSKKYTE